jgi:hypothetical protein
VLERGPSSSMTTMDNQVGGGGVAATYCIDYRVVCYNLTFKVISIAYRAMLTSTGY